ncbi:MAG: NTP transferase domain-containing protein, partial [Candidatus Brocadiae bacterium]|nr:NTP transferase domain-containing protein [Candidatus Brocadiia bacterium]
MRSDVYSITLAAGAGRRMLEDMPAKPCCKIGPISVIENAFQTYEEAGVLRHVVVVGRRAEEVMDEVHRARPLALLAYQSEPRGTGDAVRCAMDLLAALGPPARVLISYGDKVIDLRVVRGLLETCAVGRLDLGLVAGPSNHYPAAGRIVVRNDRAVAILEVPDIQVRQLAARLRSLKPHEWPENVGTLKDLTVQHVPNAARLARGFPALSALLDGPSDVPVPTDQVRAAARSIPEDFALRGGTVSLEEAATSQLCNLSVYVGRFEPLYQAVQELGAENVQGEFYFTDVVDILTASGHKVGLFRIEDPEDVMAFNTPEDLEAVRKVHAVRALSRTQYPSLEAWNRHFARREPGGLSADAVRLLAQKTGPERPCVVVRSPGRINLMGRHVDHQGGRCNLIAIDREIVIAASPRDDDRVNLWNAEAADYPPRSFTFRELTTDIVWEDWLRTLDSQYLRRMVSRSAGEWVNYVKGAALRLQHRFPDRPLRGMDALVAGNIPVGAGLSSSSALVVAAAESLAEINALNLRPREFVDLCGEGEWFVGTRGEAGDHAAIKFGRPNEVVTVSFFPFEVVGRQPFPEDYGLIICRSGVSAEKMQGTRERLNARVACYH